MSETLTIEKLREYLSDSAGRLQKLPERNQVTPETDDVLSSIVETINDIS